MSKMIHFFKFKWNYHINLGRYFNPDLPPYALPGSSILSKPTYLDSVKKKGGHGRDQGGFVLFHVQKCIFLRAAKSRNFLFYDKTVQGRYCTCGRTSGRKILDNV